MQVPCRFHVGYMLGLLNLAYWWVTSMTTPWNLHGICMEPPWNLHQSEYRIGPHGFKKLSFPISKINRQVQKNALEFNNQVNNHVKLLDIK